SRSRRHSGGVSQDGARIRNGGCGARGARASHRGAPTARSANRRRLRRSPGSKRSERGPTGRGAQRAARRDGSSHRVCGARPGGRTTCAVTARENRMETTRTEGPSFHPSTSQTDGPGIEFTETMRGFMSTKVTDDYQAGHDQGERDGSPFEFTVTVTAPNID